MEASGGCGAWKGDTNETRIVNDHLLLREKRRPLFEHFLKLSKYLF